MSNISYLDMINVLQNHYQNTSTPDIWVQLTQGGITPEKMEILEQAGVKATLSRSGNVLGYSYDGALPSVSNPASLINSNLETGLYGSGSFNAQLPGTAVTDSQTGTTTMMSGLKDATTGNTVMSIASDIGLAIGAAALGTKLGKAIDGALYSLAPDWWDEHYPSINPETWADITEDNDLGSNLFRGVFGISSGTENTTMYLDERALAYTYAMLLANGAWTEAGKEVIDAPQSFPDVSAYLPFAIGSFYAEWINNNRYLNQLTVSSNNAAFYNTNNGLYGYSVLGFSDSPGDITFTKHLVRTDTRTGTVIEDSTENDTITLSSGSAYTFDNKTVYSGVKSISTGNPTTFSGNINILSDSIPSALRPSLAWLCLYNYIEHTPVEGISDNPNAGYQITPTTVINQTTGQPVTPQDSIDDILNALKLAFPQLFDGAIYEDVMQPDGTIDRLTYVPTPYPDTENPTQPVTDMTPGIDPQQNPEVNPESRPENELQDLTDSITESTTTPDTGSGTTPPFLPPDGTANALYAIYNPSQGELNSFGAWLWSSNFVDQLLKLFNDPMQAIIGLHKVFVTPVISGRQNIKVGYLDSGVSSNVVGAQYVTVDCGSVTIPEYFGNVFDYDPFTQIYLYLPFVGIQRLDTGDVMRSTLNVIYHCDVLTGACLVEVNVIRDGGGGVIYTYTGNCAVQYPISSGSYMGIIASLASVVGGVVGTIATGGALAPVALGAVSGIMNAHTRVEHSGGFSGNAGAMGIKKPYVIITRPQTCLADNFPAYNGYPANKLTYVGDCTGYIRCDECHIEQVPGTDAELSELESLLKSGIII